VFVPIVAEWSSLRLCPSRDGGDAYASGANFSVPHPVASDRGARPVASSIPGLRLLIAFTRMPCEHVPP